MKHVFLAILLAILLAVALAGCGDVTWLPTPKPVPVITTSSLPDAPINLTYNVTLTATGGTAPYTWSLASGTLPPGLSLNADGTLTGGASATPPSGTSANAGTYTITIKVSDSQSPPGNGTKSYTIFAPTTGRMYDTSHTVYAENLTYDSSTNTIAVTLGNGGAISHSVQAVVANFGDSGSEISGSSTTLATTTPLSAGTATATPVEHTLSTTSAVNNWRIKSVTLQ